MKTKTTIIPILLLLLSLTLFSSCTDNSMVKKFGGKKDITLLPDTKVVNVTWKEEDIWILSKPMKSTDSAESYYFTEKSNYGIIEGTYRIQEIKSNPTVYHSKPWTELVRR